MTLLRAWLRGRGPVTAAMLIVSGVLVYGNSLWGSFVFDDRSAIVTNPGIRHLWPLWDVLRAQPLTARPVVNASLALNYAFGGLDARGYHAFNMGVHVLAAIALYGLIRRTLTADLLRRRFEQSAEGIAAASAVLWLVHPLQTETVNYVIQRSESIMGLFYLLTLYAAIRAHEPKYRRLWSCVSVAACSLGMASKEVMVTAPVMVVLHDWMFRTESFALILRRRLALYLGLAATWGLLGILIWSAVHSGTAGFSTTASPLTYALNQPLMVIQYFRLAVWPRPLLLDYGFPQRLTFAEAAPAAIALGIVVIATAWSVARRRPWAFALAWTLLILAPTSSIVPIATEVGAERRMYLPLAGLVVLAVALGFLALERMPTPSRRAFRLERPALVVAVAVAMAWTSARRNREYRDEKAMWYDVLAHRPGWRPHANLGLLFTIEGRYSEAIEHYYAALRGNPDSLEVHYTLAFIFERQGDVDKAIEHYQTFLRFSPESTVVRDLLARALARRETQ